jgi:hypothetical protein
MKYTCDDVVVLDTTVEDHESALLIEIRERFFVVSVAHRFGNCYETCVYRSDPDGCIDDWGEVVCVPGIDHYEAIEWLLEELNT